MGSVKIIIHYNNNNNLTSKPELNNLILVRVAKAPKFRSPRNVNYTKFYLKKKKHEKNH